MSNELDYLVSGLEETFLKQRGIYEKVIESSEMTRAYLVLLTVLQIEARGNWNNYYVQVYVKIVSQ